jgi:hypothetical protein
VELCLGVGSETPDQTFPNIKALFNQAVAAGRDNLVSNLMAVQAALNLDAVCLDDEVEYDLASSVWLAQQCGALGMKVTIAPYCRAAHWNALIAAANVDGQLVDTNYLQCFATGTIAGWSYGGIKPVAGMYLDQFEPPLSPGGATAQLEAWRNASPGVSLAGGWYYNAGEILADASLGTFEQYSQAIPAGLG